jgi:hypothetical protein
VEYEVPGPDVRGVCHLFMDEAIKGIASALVDPFAIQPFVIPGQDAASFPIKGETK